MSMMLLPLAVDKPKQAEHHWTVEEFYHAYDAGQLDDSKRWELIQGRIIEKMSIGPPHAALADIIAQMLRDVMQPSLIVREEKPVHLSYDTELVPDITVAHGARADYRQRHPTAKDTALLVEVADTFTVKDLGEKAQSYAQAGVADYWVVLVNEASIVIHRNPTPEGYEDVRRLTGSDSLSPMALPEVVWTVGMLLGEE